MMESAGVATAWVGARDLVNVDVFVFVMSAEVVPEGMWAMGEPDHSDGDCVILDATAAGLVVANCEESLAFICQV